MPSQYKLEDGNQKDFIDINVKANYESDFTLYLYYVKPELKANNQEKYSFMLSDRVYTLKAFYRMCFHSFRAKHYSPRL